MTEDEYQKHLVEVQQQRNFDEEQKNRLPAGVVDRSAFNWGGDPNAANNYAGKLDNIADQAQNRQGEHIDTGWADHDRETEQSSRGAQLRMADMMYRRASGQVPSIAGQRADIDIGRAVADQSSIAASARGPAALALASQQAANNSAGAIANISNTAQVNSAQERSDAEKAAFGGYSTMRQGDQAQQGQDFGQAAQQAGLNAAQRAANDAYSTNARQQSIGVQNTQMTGQMNRDAAEQAGHFNAQAAQYNKDKDADANTLGYVSSAAQTAAAVAPLVASDERTKVPVTWGGAPSAPTGPEPTVSDPGLGYMQGQQTWGTPAQPHSDVDMSRIIARRALDEQAGREIKSASRDATSPNGIAGGPQAVDMNPGRRWDTDDLATIRAKERNGVELSEKETRSKASLQHRDGEAKKDDAAKKTDEKDAKAPPKTTAEQVGAGAGAALGGIGKAIGQMASDKRTDSVYRYQPAQTYGMPQQPMPMMTTSDDHAKVALAQREAFSAGLAHANTAADTGKFGPVPSYMEEHGKHQPAEAAHKAASGTPRADAGPQRAENAESQKNYDKAAAASLAAVPLGWGGTLGALHAQKSEEAYQRDRSIMAQRMAKPDKPREMQSFSRGDSTVDTSLSPKGEASFQEWKKQYAPKDSGADYDLRGAYKAGIKPDPQSGHWPDTYKKPNHETFSDESQYAKQGRPGHWEGETYIPPPKGKAQPADAGRPAAMSPVDREEKHQPGVRAMANQALFGAPSANDEPIAMSDERSKDRADVGTLGKEMPHDAMAEAARSMRGVPYKYKSQFAAQEGQAPGEVNVGPVAQEMEKSPVAATAVKEDPRTGMRGIDIPKYTKVLGAVAADQQEEIDDLHKQMSFMARRLGGRR